MNGTQYIENNIKLLPIREWGYYTVYGKESKHSYPLPQLRDVVNELGNNRLDRKRIRFNFLSI